MKKIGVFTIISKNYFAYAKTLLNSIAKFHPEYQSFLCLADKVDGYFENDAGQFRVIQADEIGIPSFDDMALRYDIMEFNTAVKPFMFRWLFDNSDLDSVIYMDPDTRVYSRFEKLECLLESGASVVLTPHITTPLEDDKLPNDYHMLQSGVFNLGFMAANRSQETLDYIDWWGRRLTTQCLSDVSNSLFTDQKWCDLAPCFLDNLSVFKDPGYNAAYWNLAQRQVHHHPKKGWLVNGEPLAFFHFSGVSLDNKCSVSKHQNRFEWKDIESCQKLFSGYLDELKVNGSQDTSRWPYAYAVTPQGMIISQLMRRLYREQNVVPIRIESSDVEEYLIQLCNKRDNDFIDEGAIPLSKVMTLIYRLRPDIQAAFSLSDSEGRRQFVDWFESAGEREYSLPSSVISQQDLRDIDQKQKKNC